MSDRYATNSAYAIAASRGPLRDLAAVTTLPAPPDATPMADARRNDFAVPRLRAPGEMQCTQSECARSGSFLTAKTSPFSRSMARTDANRDTAEIRSRLGMLNVLNEP